MTDMGIGYIGKSTGDVRAFLGACWLVTLYWNRKASSS